MGGLPFKEVKEGRKGEWSECDYIPPDWRTTSGKTTIGVRLNKLSAEPSPVQPQKPGQAARGSSSLLLVALQGTSRALWRVSGYTRRIPLAGLRTKASVHSF